MIDEKIVKNGGDEHGISFKPGAKSERKKLSCINYRRKCLSHLPFVFLFCGAFGMNSGSSYFLYLNQPKILKLICCEHQE